MTTKTIQDAQYCPICGVELVQEEVHGRERLTCQECGFILYFNPKVAAGVLVEDDEKVVLIRRGMPPRAGYWALPSGFAEIDETIEETAVRECQEETGLEVELDDLLNVYSYRSEVYGLGVLVLYSAYVVGGEMRAGDDAAAVDSFAPDELPDRIAFHTHQEALKDWKEAAGVVYRRATAEEADAIGEIKQAHRYRPDEDYQKYVRSDDVVLLAAIDRQEPVGFATLYRREGAAELDQLFVIPRYRRWGIATHLIERGIELAQEWGYERVVAPVPAENPGLVVYLKAGFRVSDFEEDEGATLLLTHETKA